MRRPSVFLERRNDLDATMTPMIDVVFLLLIFFVWTASFQVVEYVLPSSLSTMTGSQPQDPNEPPPPEEDFDQVVVRLRWDAAARRPVFLLNDQTLAGLADVRARLKLLAGIKSDAPVILHPDADVPLGDVIDVYDEARRSGFSEVRFATTQKI